MAEPRYPAPLPSVSAAALVIGSVGALSELGSTAAVDVGFLLAAVPLLSLAVGRSGLLLAIAPGAGALLGFLLALPAAFAPGSIGPQLLSGELLGLPLLLASVLLPFGRSAPVHLLAVVGGLSLLLTDYAALGTSPRPPGAFAQAFASASSTQGAGLSALVHGLTPASLPLQQLPGAGFAALALLALASALLSFLVPTDRREGTAEGAAFEELAPVGVSVLAATAFEVLAVRAPSVALIALTFGVLATLSAIGFLAARTRRVTR